MVYIEVIALEGIATEYRRDGICLTVGKVHCLSWHLRLRTTIAHYI